jgi:dihydroneopterin aldolase
VQQPQRGARPDMTLTSTIELRDMILPTDIGTYGPDNPMPDHHLLDLILSIAPTKILIPSDGMVHVFDYDPLIVDIRTLAKTGHRETQEWLISQIAHLCATFDNIQGADIFLRKFPIHQESGTLGVRLTLQQDDLVKLRNAPIQHGVNNGTS